MHVIVGQHFGANLSAQFEAFKSTRSGPVRFVLAPPCPPASTAPWEGPSGGRLEAVRPVLAQK